MVGPWINSAAIIAGGILGVFCARYVPQRLREGLPATFALASISIGIVMVIKVHNMPAVIFALILGTTFGELFSLERGVKWAAGKVQHGMARIITTRSPLPPTEFAQEFTAMLVLFCASGLGIVGALTEGLNGNYQLLLIKSMMDFFTAMIFSISLGITLVTIAVPQLLIQSALFGLALWIMPYMDEAAFADFSACGGIIMVAVGFRIAQIKIFSVVNFLPALLFVVPFSYGWRALIN
ncbi:DUF554 domain-containing protein [Klebsiella sp. BIGb0407]|uniref:DUF554 domain-containing protein n=1 Tax=Klebsiella sp. BIGb0407 TaxID=2940603 RepID=UPI00216975B3|nr:DUF554 domain-containing protein [Klebsiella sp. BIGb0407]MCS3429804.1 putative membrane protein YqgA involved in biofilm formation [Klebsiella sp. BIGb0407]